MILKLIKLKTYLLYNKEYHYKKNNLKNWSQKLLEWLPYDSDLII